MRAARLCCGGSMLVAGVWPNPSTWHPEASTSHPPASSWRREAALPTSRRPDDAPPAVYEGPGYGAGYTAPRSPMPIPATARRVPPITAIGLSAARLRCSRLCLLPAMPPGYAAACPSTSRLRPLPATVVLAIRRARLGYSGPGYRRSGLRRRGYPPPAPGYGRPGYVAPGPATAVPLTTRANYGRPAGYAERRLTNVNAYAAEGPPRPPAAIPRVGSGRCVVNLGNGRWAACN